MSRSPSVMCKGLTERRCKCPARMNCLRFRAVPSEDQRYMKYISATTLKTGHCSKFIFKGDARPLVPMTKGELELLGGGV